MNTILVIEDARLNFTLPRSRAGAWKFNYLLRVPQPHLADSATRIFCNHIESKIWQLIGGFLSHQLYRELTLPHNSENWALEQV